MPVCAACRSQRSDWAQVPGTGTVFSYTIAAHPTHPALRGRPPYNIAVVLLDGAGEVRLVSNVMEVANEDLAIGMRVRLHWDALADGQLLPRFVPMPRIGPMRNGQGTCRQDRIVGVGETDYGRRGALGDRTELSLCIEAIRRAADDAGVPLDEVDGFTSFGFERHEPVLIQAALGIPELRHSSIVWGGGGGGCTAAVMNAAMAVATGLCRNAVVYRSICQGQYERYGQARAADLRLLLQPVRPVLAGADDGADDAAAHASLWHQPRASGRGGDHLPPPRAAQPARHHARQAARSGRPTSPRA